MPTLEQTLITASKTPPPTSLKDGELRAVDLDLLDDNPFQPRLQMADDALNELVDSIRANGLLQPILVRPKSDGRYVIVAGHRRTTAMRKLRDAAAEAEKAKYSRIDATLRLALDDGQLAIFAYSENVTREGLTAVEEGRALERLAEATGLRTAEEVAEAVSQPVMKIKRLRRIAKAPKFLQGAIEGGLLVVVSKDKDGVEQKERRRLDLNAALAFYTLYDHLLEKQKLKAEKAEARTLAGMRRALAANWPFRRVEDFVKAVVAGKQALTEDASQDVFSEELPPVFETTARRFTVDLKRLATATAEQKAALEIAFRTLLGPGTPDAGSAGVQR